MGLDLICHEPQLENAIKNLLSFLGKFVTVLQTAFHPDGPKCYKKNNYPQKNSFFRAEIPKLIILTIPYIDNHPTASTYKQKIIAMNDALRNYVKKNKAKLFKDHNFIIEIYDWEKESKNYRQCNRNDMESRFKILTTALSEKYQMFIVEQERPKNSQENDFQDSAED
uniref:Uncharacterized protein n=1 Tax=Panagrolaimus superbus TaxID=310955 RepID=A0A914YYZ6_9BILA